MPTRLDNKCNSKTMSGDSFEHLFFFATIQESNPSIVTNFGQLGHMIRAAINKNLKIGGKTVK